MSKGTGRAEHSRLFSALLDPGLREAAERLGRDSRYRGKIMTPALGALAQNMRLALGNGRLTLDPPAVFAARVVKGAGRLIAVYALQEVVLITALHRLLAGSVDEKLLAQCIGGRRGYLLEARGLALSEPKTGIYHRYQQGFKFLGLRVIGDSAQPTPENAARFAEEFERYLRCGRRKALDEKVRAAPRAHLKERGGEPFVNARFRVPSRFPENLAYTNGELAPVAVGRPGASAPPQIVEVSQEGAGLPRIVLRAAPPQSTVAPQTGGL